MKNILITGASGDIGSEISRTLAKIDTRLFLVYNHNIESITKLRDELSNTSEVYTYQCDLSNDDAVKSMIENIITDFKHIDILVNCAGVSKSKQIQDYTKEDIDFILNSNLTSTILTTKYVSKNMITNKYGKIVNISSMWGVVGASMESVYSASKGAINSFTLSLAKELGPSNINVNAICPGLIDTKMNSCYSKQDLQGIVDNTPIGRIGTTKDVANLVAFLTDDKSSFITGQIITLDGGLTL